MRIEICGNIAAGKTTLCDVLSARGASPIYENFKENPFWEVFYANPRLYAFETELTFMLQHYSAMKGCSGSSIYVCDYSLVLDLAYADVNLSGARLKLFERLADELEGEVGPPDLLIRLTCPEEVLLERIHNRAREAETTISLEYLQDIDRALSRRVANLSVPVVFIDSHVCNYTVSSEGVPHLW